MIPLFKLFQLPRSQRLRKAASIIAAAERQLTLSGELTAKEIQYLDNLALQLAKDDTFSPAQTAALKAAQASFGNIIAPNAETRRALNTLHHILLAETGRYQSDWDFIGTSGVLDPSKRRSFPGMKVYLEDIRSPFNVGSMFRAAESFGAEKLMLSPLCADPRHKRAERTAMGCVDILPWERLMFDPFSAGEETSVPFAEGNFFAMETGGIPLAEFPFPARGILIAGSEELGVSPAALAAADASTGRVTIPCYGAKGSLNVSVVFGIVMQAWAEAIRHRKNRKKVVHY